MFKITYDPEAKALYIYFKDIEPGQVDHTEEVVKDSINVDYDKTGSILGIEVLNLD